MSNFLDYSGLTTLVNKIKSTFLYKNQAPVKIVDDVVYGKDYLTIYGSGAIDINNKRYYINSNTEDVGGDLTKYVDDKQSIIIDDSMYPLTVVIPEGSNISYVDCSHVDKNKITYLDVLSTNGIYPFVGVHIDFSDMNIKHMKVTITSNLHANVDRGTIDLSYSFYHSTIEHLNISTTNFLKSNFSHAFTGAHIINLDSLDTFANNFSTDTNLDYAFCNCYVENNNIANLSTLFYGIGDGSLTRAFLKSYGVLPTTLSLYGSPTNLQQTFFTQRNKFNNEFNPTLINVQFTELNGKCLLRDTFANQVLLQKVVFNNEISCSFDGCFDWCCTLREIRGLDNIKFTSLYRSFAFETVTYEYAHSISSQITPENYNIANCMQVLDLSRNKSKVYMFTEAFSGASQLRVIDLRGVGINPNFDYTLENFDNYVYHDMFAYRGITVGHGYPFELTTFRLGTDFFSAPVSDFVDWSMLHKWTDSSVVESLATNLYDRAGNGITKPITIKLSDETYTALGNDNIAAAVAKGYTITK